MRLRCLLTATALAVASQSLAADCADWNTGGFFNSATLAEVRGCLEGGADASARDTDGITPLHWAAGLSDNPAVIEVLLEAGAEVNARTKTGWTSLHLAAMFAVNEAVVAALLEAGADANDRGNSGMTPLYYAASENNNPAVIEVLLEAGAEVNARDVLDHTPLHWAASDNPNPAVVAALLDAGANAAARDADGLTPWDYAKDREELKGSAAYRRLMLAVGCPEWNTREFFESATPTEVFSCLATGAEVDTRSDTLSLTPLHYAAAFNGSPTVIAALIGAGAQVNAQDSYGNTPLHSAARYSTSPAVIMTLLEAGATAAAQNGESKTPWDLAQDNEALRGTDAWWLLNDARFE